MEQEEGTVVLSLPGGAIRGTRRGAMRAFLGLPYGERSQPGRRSSDLRPVASWQRERDATRRAAVFPQGRSRLASIMGTGIEALAQSEDAFFLNVWSPADAASLPVFVFIHGGGFMSGGGSAPWYDGARLAQDGNIVVVTVNYRLGALGHCSPDGDPAGANKPVRDLLRALHWVQENIGRLGGDPAQVTVGGQSAGAWYAWLLGVSPAARGLLRRNILLSIPMVAPMSTDELAQASQVVMEGAGGRPLDALAVDEVLQRQVALMRTRVRFGEIPIGLRPAVEDGLVPSWMLDLGHAARQAHVSQTLVGSTAEETSAFFFEDPAATQCSEAAVGQWYASRFGSGANRLRAESIGRRATHTPYTQLVDGSTLEVFGTAVDQIAQAMGAAGKTAFAYRFDVQSGVPNLMSPHCMELPFLFGNRADWADARMVKDVAPAAFEQAGAQLRCAVGAFVREGAPRTVAGQRWSDCSGATPRIAEFHEGGVRFHDHRPST